MPNGTSSDQETIEATIAPFYHAIGRATARWQHVEAGLFVLAHAIMQTDYKYSSVVFLHIQNTDSLIVGKSYSTLSVFRYSRSHHANDFRRVVNDPLYQIGRASCRERV